MCPNSLHRVSILHAQIALYFAFVGTLTSSLLAPSLVGLVAVGASFSYGSTDNPFCPMYSIFILLWINSFCKTWRREEVRCFLPSLHADAASTGSCSVRQPTN